MTVNAKHVCYLCGLNATSEMIKWDDGKLFFIYSRESLRAVGVSSKWKRCSYPTGGFLRPLESQLKHLCQNIMLGFSPSSGKYQVYGDSLFNMPWFLSIHTNLRKTWPTTPSTKTSVIPSNA